MFSLDKGELEPNNVHEIKVFSNVPVPSQSCVAETPPSTDPVSVEARLGYTTHTHLSALHRHCVGGGRSLQQHNSRTVPTCLVLAENSLNVLVFGGFSLSKP